MSINYFTIVEESIHEIEIKKSRFLCYLIPIETEEEANEYVMKLKKEHYKANHHCWAYILGDNSEIQRMSDDGEPSGTAGIPMLEVLKQKQVTRILAVVVRYFGGVKLGGGGLIRAYSSSVSEAINNTIIYQNISQIIVNLRLSYDLIDPLNYFIQTCSYRISVLGQTYEEEVIYELAINEEDFEEMEVDLTNRMKGRIQIIQKGKKTLNIPVEPSGVN